MIFKRHLVFTLTLIIWNVFPVACFSQAIELEVRQKRLLLKLASTRLNVASQNQIDIDSGLVLASQRTGISAMIVIGESFEDVMKPNDATADVATIKTMLAQSSLHKRMRLTLLIGYHYAFRPGSRKADIDSALTYLSRGKAEAVRMNEMRSVCQALYGMGKVYLKNGDLSTADSYFIEAINLAKSINEKTEHAMALSYWGTYASFSPRTMEQRVNRLREADSLFVVNNQLESRTANMTNIGYLSFAGSKISDSWEAFNNALKFQQQMKFPFTHYTFDLLSLLSYVQGRYDDALSYSLKAVKTAEQLKDYTAFGIFCDRVGHNYLVYNDQEDEALFWKRKALAEFEKTGNERTSMYLTATTICEVLNRQSKHQEAVILLDRLLTKFPPSNPKQEQRVLLTLAKNQALLGNFTQAERNANRAIDLFEQTYERSGNIGVPGTYYELGIVFFRIEQFERARLLFNKALSFGDQLPMENRMYSEKFLAGIDSAKGDYLNAFRHARQFSELRYSQSQESQVIQMRELRVQYEAEIKDNNIKILQQKTALNEARIREDRFVKSAMIVSVGILLLVLGLLYNRFQIKQRANKQLSAQQREIIDSNRLLQQLVQDKEWLLKEVHHRVKNNLQIVISLLRTQSNYLKNDAALKAIRESQERIFAISLIHQKLYKSDDSSVINIREYTNELIDHIKESFRGHSVVVFDVSVEDVHIDVAQTVPLGLIITETISNSIKYAFPDGRPGRVTIELAPTEALNGFRLTISDNGVGLSADFDYRKKTSLGIRLMTGLSEQMGAKFNIKSQDGVRIDVTFQDEKIMDRIQSELT